MDALLLRLAHRLWPDFDSFDERDRTRLLAELATSLLSLPLVALSLGWLMTVTDFGLVRTQWPALLLVLVLGYTFTQVSFYQATGTPSGELSFNSTNLGSVLLVSSLLLLGSASRTGLVDTAKRRGFPKDIGTPEDGAGTGLCRADPGQLSAH